MADDDVRIVLVFPYIFYSVYAMFAQPWVCFLGIYIPSVARFFQAVPDGKAVVADCVTIGYGGEYLNYMW